ncbi:hypothetical protein T265_01762 [Opisthorchis viverrini]|uniref:Uncharacterized protein n=1 Tax=Opisthorchis viverrini TaxID=6198 RepID=A0A075A8X0_OPIVI|nr:hypothetical protein T265_01762 [Opisthorchis viverrini]KER32145.1 hypothetical protein T265_01762 [Opisthorchis viverrini]
MNKMIFLMTRSVMTDFLIAVCPHTVYCPEGGTPYYRKSGPICFVPKPVAPSTANKCIHAPRVTLNSQCYVIAPSAGPTSNYSLTSCFIALQEAEAFIATANGLSTLPSVSPVELLSHGPEATDAARLLAIATTTPEADSTCARHRPHDLPSLRVTPVSKYACELGYLSSRSR